MKTLKQIIADLNARGVNCQEIGRRIDHPFSAIYKVARGEQSTLGYEIGKQIEKLESHTRGRLTSGKLKAHVKAKEK